MLTIDPGCLFFAELYHGKCFDLKLVPLVSAFSASCASTLRRSKATSTRARRSRGSWWHLSCSKFWRPWSYPKLRCRDYVDEIITVYCDGLSSSGVSLRRVEAIPARERERDGFETWKWADCLRFSRRWGSFLWENAFRGDWLSEINETFMIHLSDLPGNHASKPTWTNPGPKSAGWFRALAEQDGLKFRGFCRARSRKKKKLGWRWMALLSQSKPTMGLKDA